MKLGLASRYWGSWSPRAMAFTSTRSPPRVKAMAARPRVVATTRNPPAPRASSKAKIR